jgi:hypothetical protein
MTAPTAAPPSGIAAIPVPVHGPTDVAALHRIVESLGQLADDASVPRNVRRGAQSAKDELAKARVALDVRIASAVYVLDDLANDPNLPTHGRTAIWSIISSLESLQ